MAMLMIVDGVDDVHVDDADFFDVDDKTVDYVDDIDDVVDIYIMMQCLFVCHEKSSLPPGSLL